MDEIKLGITDMFQKDCERLSTTDRRAVDMLMLRLRYGEIQGMNKHIVKSRANEGLYSYRANDDIRVITYEWRPGEILLLLADHHDAAYDKASRMELNTKKLSPSELPKPVIHTEKVVDYVVRECRLSKVPLDKLTNLVGSESAATSLQLANTEDALLKIIESLEPQQLRDDLIDLNANPEIIDALLSRQQRQRPPLQQAIKKSENWCLLTQDVLTKFQNGTLENWQVFLHPSQRTAVETDAQGPYMVTGPAGTGKTVVAVHRVKWLLSNVFTAGQKVLFTTFARVLARSAREWLEKICPPDLLQRADVRHLDEFVRDLFQRISNGKHISIRQLDQYLNIESPDELKWDRRFIAEEFEEIILEYRIATLEDYKAFQRPSRFGRLSGLDREKLWPVFEDMKRQLAKPSCAEVPKVYALNQLAAFFSTSRGNQLREYASIVVDECQDFGASEYRFFAAYTRNTFESPIPYSLFLAGDGYQRIYGRSGTFKKCGINVVNRSVPLSKCYRSTKLIREFAEQLLVGVDARNIDGDIASIRHGESLCDGVPVEEFFCPNRDEMFDEIVNKINEWRKTGPKELDNYAVLFAVGRVPMAGGRHYNLLDNAANQLSRRGLPAEVFNGRNAANRTPGVVSVMTMHSSKGLQFYGVVACLNRWPRRPPNDADADQRKAVLDEQKCLLYVAIMRALYRVLLTSFSQRGRPKELPAN